MKPQTEGTLCACIFALALIILVATAQGTLLKTSGKSLPTVGKGQYSLPDFSFARTKNGRKWLLWYRFKSPSGDWHEASCGIDAANSLAMDAAFGYQESEATAWLSKAQEKILNERMARAGMLSYGKAVISPQGRIEWQIGPGELPSSLDVESAHREELAFYAWLNAHPEVLQEAHATAEAAFFDQKSFRNQKLIGWIPDYAKLADASADLLRQCREQIQQATKGSPELLMDFFQSMQFAAVPDKDPTTGKITGGFMIPAAVMILGEGDCDSKAVAFCVIQRDATRHLILFRSFGGSKDLRHALVGVEAWGETRESAQSAQETVSLVEGVYEKPVQIGNLYYFPCEVAGGKGRALYGQVSINHNGSYVAIEMSRARS